MKGSSQYNASASGYSLDNRWSYSVNTAYNVQKESDSLKSVSGYTSYESPWEHFPAQHPPAAIAHTSTALAPMAALCYIATVLLSVTTALPIPTRWR